MKHETFLRLRRVWHKSKPYIPRRVLSFMFVIYRISMKILCRCYELFEQSHRGRGRLPPVPPPMLRYRVSGRLPTVQDFLDVGRRCIQDIEMALLKVGMNLTSFHDILDFGCGCGRMLFWLTQRSQSHLYGSDIDAEAISWCRTHLPFAHFHINHQLPPLEYPPETFDFVYSVSVFTHLDEENQFQWLSELKRVIKPKGILLLTVHGRYCWETLPKRDVSEIEKKGFHFVVEDIMKGVLPEWYQTAYHTREYIFKRYLTYFDVLEYIPRGLYHFQDIVLLRKG